MSESNAWTLCGFQHMQVLHSVLEIPGYAKKEEEKLSGWYGTQQKTHDTNTYVNNA